jgi:hypothetical protein
MHLLFRVDVRERRRLSAEWSCWTFNIDRRVPKNVSTWNWSSMLCVERSSAKTLQMLNYAWWPYYLGLLQFSKNRSNLFQGNRDKFPKNTIYADSLISYWKSIKIVRTVFERITVLYFGAAVTGSRMFIPTGRQHKMGELLKTNMNKVRPSVQASARCTYVYIQVCKKKAGSEVALQDNFRIQECWKLTNSSQFRDLYIMITVLFHNTHMKE